MLPHFLSGVLLKTILKHISDARKPSHHQKMVMYSTVSAFCFSCVSFLQLLNALKAMKFYVLREIQQQVFFIWLTLNIFGFFKIFNQQTLLWNLKHSIFHLMSWFFHCNNILIEQRTGKTMPHVLLNLDHKVNLKQNLLPVSFSSANGKKN